MAHPLDVRRRRLPFLWVALLLFLMLLAAAPSGRCGMQPIPTDPQKGVRITVSSWYDTIPFEGFAPLDVTIHNTSGATRTWTMYCTSPESYGQELQAKAVFTFKVENKEKRTFRVLAPLLSEGSSYYQSVNLTFGGYGASMMSSTSFTGAVYGGGKFTRFTLFSSTLMPGGVTALSEDLKKASWGLAGSRVDLRDMPDDWRALAGADFLYLLAEDLAALGTAQRVALQDWLACGGELFIYGAKEVPADLRQSGFGKVHLDPTRIADTRSISEALQKAGTPARDAAPNAVERWSAFRFIGLVRPNAPLLSLCMLVFAAVIGPVNLFFFASANRRARLFWTTPLLSLGASAILFVIIIFQDGLGGSGVRNALICLQPDRKKAAVVQEQISRTGVLTRSRFTIRDPAVVAPIGTDKLSKNQSSSYFVQGNDFSGAWFRSRAVQAQWIEAVVSTRAEITVTPSPDGPPTIISSIDAPLKNFHYRDAQGRIWTAPDVHTGTRVTLQPSSRVPRDLGIDASPALNAEFTRMGVPNGSFFANTADPKLLVPTLPGIDWDRSLITIIGPVTEVHR